MYKKTKIVLIISIIFNFLLAQSNANNSNLLSLLVKSALLPGWGEYSLGEKSRGNIFVTTEIIGLALTAFSFIKSNDYTSTYKSVAAEHAKVDVDDKDHQFWVDIGNYASQSEYNEEHLRWRDIKKLYPQEKVWDWNWKSDVKRQEFEDLRVNSDQLKLAGKFFIGGLVLNHIISIIDVYYINNTMNLSSEYNPDTKALIYSLYFDL